LIKQTADSGSDELTKHLDTIIDPYNVDVLIIKLRSKVSTLTNEQVSKLAISISKLGHRLPDPATFLSVNTFGLGAMLISDCIESIEDREEQVKLALEVFQNGEPLDFVAECFRWLRKDTEGHPDPKGFSVKEVEILGKEMAGRISKELKDKRQFSEKGISVRFPQLLYIWKKYGVSSEQSVFLRLLLEENPNFVMDLLESYLATSWGSDGIPKKSDLERREYNSIIQIIDPVYIVLYQQ
jgi:hypothetical protein